MDVHLFNKKLNKIAALADNTRLSSLERDLLLSYIRELYELVVVETEMVTPKVRVPENKVSNSSIQSEPIIHDKMETPVQKIEKSIVYAAAEVEVLTAPIVEKTSVENIKHTPVKSSNQQSDAMLEIFAEEKIQDLSDKLALSAVKDLTKSMGINERIFTQQELFSNDQTALNEVLSKLNLCVNFEEAKEYLATHVIQKYNWTEENKVKKAATFVRLVKRKFI